MTNSFGYSTKDDLPDEQIVNGTATIRELLDALRACDPQEQGVEVYVNTYDDMQNSYAAALHEARRRGLSLPEWDGDALVFTELDGWHSFE